MEGPRLLFQGGIMNPETWGGRLKQQNRSQLHCLSRKCQYRVNSPSRRNIGVTLGRCAARQSTFGVGQKGALGALATKRREAE